MVDEEQRCTACSSLDQGLGLFFNNDDEAEFTFVGTQVILAQETCVIQLDIQVPINEKLYQILKQASLRSLSVEVSAPVSNCSQPESSYSPSKSHNGSSNIYSTDMERDGVVLFGDDDNWYTLSHTFRFFESAKRKYTFGEFKVKRCKSAGFPPELFACYCLYGQTLIASQLRLPYSRTFCIDHKTTSQFKSVHTYSSILQEMTNSFFALEQENDSDLRLASNMKTTHWLPHQFYPKQYALDTSRSLKVITNHENIFALLHK